MTEWSTYCPKLKKEQWIPMYDKAVIAPISIYMSVMEYSQAGVKWEEMVDFVPAHLRERAQEFSS